MASQTTFDSGTAETIRRALAAAQAGRIEDACAIGELGIANGGNPAALHALLGSLLCRAGEMPRAIPHLRIARTARPFDPIITRNLATALLESGKLQDAIACLTDELIATDRSCNLLRLRAYAFQTAGDLPAAIVDYQTLVARHPEDWEAWNNLGNAKLSSGDASTGLEALRRSATLNPRSAPTRLNLARALHEGQQLREAEAELRAMAQDFPQDPTPLGYLFGLLQAQGLDDAAEAALRAALARDSANVGMLIALGRQYLLRFETIAAERVFRRVILLEPSNGDAFLGLADVLEHERPDGLAALLAEAEAANIDAPRLALIRALLARREKDFERGAAALKDVPANFDPVRRWHLQGQIFDGLGDYDQAFDAFRRMNRSLASEPTQPMVRAAEFRDRLRATLGKMTPEWRQSWISDPMLPDRPSPVFLVGFPRSGTTLLDTMLMGHPSTEVMEEKPVVAQIREETGGFDAIAGMDAREVRRLQQRYFELASGFASLRDGATLIDKSPLHMQNLPLIYRLFPDARVLLALRHPADVALSCFMAKFRMNVSMANFVDLETIAEFYDLTFAMWEQALGLLPVEVHPIVYERMVVNPEAELRPVVEALGLAWSPEILNHERTAKARGIITTASYAQVTEPLYQSASGRWRRYRKHLEPILPVLEPWIDRLGYQL